MNEFDFLDDFSVSEEAESGFRIDDDAKADWALKKVLEERRELDRLKEIADAQKKEIDEKIEQARTRCENKTSYLLGCLAVYFDGVEHKTTKTQESYQLLSGKLVRKKGTLKTDVDKDALVAYLKERDGGAAFIKTKEEPDWANFKKVLELDAEAGAIDPETGELLECIVLTQQPDTFDVKEA